MYNFGNILTMHTWFIYYWVFQLFTFYSSVWSNVCDGWTDQLLDNIDRKYIIFLHLLLASVYRLALLLLSCFSRLSRTDSFFKFLIDIAFQPSLVAQSVHTIPLLKIKVREISFNKDWNFVTFHFICTFWLHCQEWIMQ